MPLRLLARAAPFLLGAGAAAIWLRRRRPERRALPMPTEPPPEAAPAGDLVTPPPAGRFEPASERPSVDIVTVVDDLLGAAR